MGIAAGDYDGDGFLDIFKTNFFDDTSDLYHNNGDGSFTNMIYPVGVGFNTKFLGWGVGFIDYDDDGWPDVFIANGHVYPEVEAQYPGEPYRQHKILYHNLGNGKFDDVSNSAGPGILSNRSSRGVAFADFNNDGHVEIAINNQNDSPSLLRNEGNYRHHWVEIQTVGIKSNRAGIGTRVKVIAGGRAQINEVRSGGSYLSQSDLRLHFGLGGNSKIELLELVWPSGVIDRITNAPIDCIITVREETGIIAVTGGELRRHNRS
jgi:hypothetical protein